MTIPGQSGSPIYVKRGDKLRLVGLVGLAGQWTVDIT